MSSYCWGGTIAMRPNKIVQRESLDGYPFSIPKVFLEGCREDYFPQYCFDWMDDSVIVVRGKIVTKYTQSLFRELLAEDEDGNIVWMDGRNAPFSNCCNGKYLDEMRGAMEFSIEEFDIETSEKRKYKVTLEQTTHLNDADIERISKYIDTKPTDNK